jgi:hypothetical protein
LPRIRAVSNPNPRLAPVINATFAASVIIAPEMCVRAY